MDFINTDTSAYPVTRAEIEEVVGGHVAWPDENPPTPFAAVSAVEAPALDEGETLAEGAPEETEAGWRQTWIVSSPSRAALTALVNRDRDTRIAGNFVFGDHAFQTKQSDRENIIRKGDRAERFLDKAADAGAEAGNLFWDATLPAEQPFVFIAADNAQVPMDAATMVALRDAGETFKQTCVFIAVQAKAGIAAAASDAGAKAIYDAIAWPPSEPA